MYMGDSLFCLQNQRAMKTRLSEIMTRKVDNRSGDEIAADIIKRAGLKVVKE